MLLELQEDSFDYVSELFSDLDRYYLVIRAVIEGSIPGRIWVDSVDNPSSAFLCDRWRFFLAGNPNNVEFNRDLTRLILDEIVPDAKARGYDRFSHHFNPESWKNRSDILLDRFSIKGCDVYYVFDTKKSSILRDITINIPDGFTLGRITKEILEQYDSEHSQNLSKMISQYWGSSRNFFQNGFGFCLKSEEEMLSWCITDYIVGNRTELGVETNEEYRKRGFASIVAASTISGCLKRNVNHIGWQAWKSNIASAKTAEKLCFKKTGETTVYFAPVKIFFT